ncbi:MAG: beta-lactamase family protein [Ignavibacteriales bacterium]|nr:beta-lactamase family protein [Ignavibacteriales bacterium]
MNGKNILSSRKNVCGSLFLFFITVVCGQESAQLRSFMDEMIECDRYVFGPGDLPKFRWSNELQVENLIGKFPLKVTYFDSDFQQVTSTNKPGRYGAVIEGITPAGFIVKRYVTLFCAPVDFDDYSMNVPIVINQLKDYGIPNEQWKRYNDNIERFSFGNLKYFPKRDADAAIFLAGLNELDSVPNKYDTPRIKDRQWWITLKRKLEGHTGTKNPLAVPQKVIKPTSVSLSDSEISFAKYDSVKLENLRSVCSEWGVKGNVPHVSLIVHKGKVIFHEAFGTGENGKSVPIHSLMWAASITKLLTGVLMMQFVDQGIVDLDAPVSRYLPELSGKANDKLTVRHLFIHITGLHFAGEWASDWNGALENQVAHVLPTVNVGESFSYNRVGYAIAGKIMERITGCAVPYLFRDYLFQPIGMYSAYSDNTYGGLYCTAMDLARFGQMLLNRGEYNGFKFFSAQTFEKMLPEKLANNDRRWGIGTSPMNKYGLSESAFGHGAASGTVFCIDPKNELIIVSARNSEGKSHREYEKKFIESVVSLVHQN